MTKTVAGRPRVLSDEQRRENNRLNQARFQQRKRDLAKLNKIVLEKVANTKGKEKALWSDFLVFCSTPNGANKKILVTGEDGVCNPSSFEDLRSVLLNDQPIAEIGHNYRGKD